MRGEAPDVYDGGQQTRCFTYVDDVIDAVIAAATEPVAIGEVFNIGNPAEVTIGEVVSLCIEVSGADVTPVDVRTDEKYGPVYEDIVRRVPDVTKASELLGWKATTSIRDGIAKTISWARDNPWYLA